MKACSPFFCNEIRRWLYIFIHAYVLLVRLEKTKCILVCLRYMSIYVGTLYIDYNPKVALDTYIPYKAMCDAIFCKAKGLKIDIVLSYLPHVYGLFSLSVE